MSKAGVERAGGFPFFSGGSGRPPWWGVSSEQSAEMMACLPAPEGSGLGGGCRQRALSGSMGGGTDHSSEQARRLMEGFKQSNIVFKSHFGCCVRSSLWRDRGLNSRDHQRLLQATQKTGRWLWPGLECHRWPKVLFWMHWRRSEQFYWWTGGKGHQTRLQDFSATAERMGDKPQGNMRLKRKGVNQEFGAHQVPRPLEHPRGDREGRWTCRSLE